jgi:hypothetical protein
MGEYKYNNTNKLEIFGELNNPGNTFKHLRIRVKEESK